MYTLNRKKEDEIHELERQIRELRNRVQELKKDMDHEVSDYEFSSSKGKVNLSELFGDSEELIVIHNMGKSCPYCTLWADGINGMAEHFLNRVPVVISSPDTTEEQEEFGKARNWTIPMVSTIGNSFKTDLSFETEDGAYLPGFSVFTRNNGKLFETARESFGPGDDYCHIWHMLYMLPKGVNKWRPKFSYD